MANRSVCTPYVMCNELKQSIRDNHSLIIQYDNDFGNHGLKCGRILLHTPLNLLSISMISNKFSVHLSKSVQ